VTEVQREVLFDELAANCDPRRTWTKLIDQMLE
jgi:hypothetical protein